MKSQSTYNSSVSWLTEHRIIELGRGISTFPPPPKGCINRLSQSAQSLLTLLGEVLDPVRLSISGKCCQEHLERIPAKANHFQQPWTEYCPSETLILRSLKKKKKKTKYYYEGTQQVQIAVSLNWQWRDSSSNDKMGSSVLRHGADADNKLLSIWRTTLI